MHHFRNLDPRFTGSGNLLRAPGRPGQQHSYSDLLLHFFYWLPRSRQRYRPTHIAFLAKLRANLGARRTQPGSLTSPARHPPASLLNVPRSNLTRRLQQLTKNTLATH